MRNYDALRRQGFAIILGMSFTAALLGGPPVAGMASASPEGLWETVSDRTGKVTSIVRIWIENGKAYGRVEQLFRKPDQDPNPICTKCPDEQKNQPIKGLTILWDLSRDGEEWSGGYILDPDNGETYRCILTLAKGGQELHVRGYIGFSLFGRTQVWHRVDNAVAEP